MSLMSKGIALQKEYADKRNRALNKRDDTKIVRTIEMISILAEKNGVKLSSLAHGEKAGWQVVYDRIFASLQKADLTINLDAESWFGQDNQYSTYATTYQRQMTKVGGKDVLKTQYKENGSVSEDANIRLFADEKVTIPDSWKTASILHPQRRRLAKAMSTGDKRFDAMTQVDVGGGKVGYEIDNRHFNPNAKQVFAAVNYGFRPHGASINYGFSHMKLSDTLKARAIYFPGDTFGIAAAANATARQCTFQTIGALIGYAAPDLADAIWAACYNRRSLPDTAEASLLMEAHIFQDVKIAQHVEALYLSRNTRNGAMSNAVWATVMGNARSWCARNSIRLIQVSD